MDGMQALAGLLAAGAAAASKEVAGQAVKDLYAGLKRAVKAFVDRPETVDALETAPASAAEVEAELRAVGEPVGPEIAELAAKLAAALQELQPRDLERAGIEIGAVTAAQSAILRDFDAEGSIRIASVSAEAGDAVISGMSAGSTSRKN